MKEGIHPNYREVLFVDLSNGFKFVTRACANTKDKETFEGKEYPMYKLDTSSESHPFYTGTQKSVDNMVDVWSVSATASARRQRSNPLPAFVPKGSSGNRAAFFIVFALILCGFLPC